MIIVSEQEERLDVFLAGKLDISRSKVQKLIKDKLVLVNGNIVSSSYQVKKDDRIEVNDDLNYEMKVDAENIDLDIIYEDDDLLVINKKSGMVVHPAPGHYTGTLVNALLYHFNIESKDKLRPGIVHRLDKDTSGLMLVAKNDLVLEKLADMISKKEVQRCYVAIVDGVIPHDNGTMDAPIGRDIKDRQKMAVTSKNAKEAITHFRVLKRFRNNTLIECRLETGRTHQIRVHLSYIGFPVSNDPIYGRKKATSFGQMLHSKSIKFKHPRTGEELYFEVEPPKEFLDKLGYLERDN